MGLLEKTEQNILRFSLISDSARVLVGVSGGVDSMVLLEVLRDLGRSRQWSLVVGHFNHQLRGKASGLDENLVRETAARHAIPTEFGRADVEGVAKEKGVSVEMAGRELRHLFLEEAAGRHGCTVIALAHHADDQVETFWLRLLRGEVGSGWAGMRWKRRGIAKAESVEVVRPLLNITKSEICAYAQTENILFREDASNLNLHYQRNRLRHEILPALEKFQPHLSQISVRTAGVLLAEKQFLTDTAREWLQQQDRAFASLHIALQREVIRVQLLALKVNPSFDLIEHLRVLVSEPTTVSPGLDLFRDEGGIIRLLAHANRGFGEGEKRISLQVPGREFFGGLDLRWEFASGRGAAEDGVEYFDAERVGREAVLRFWRPGDRYQPIGTDHSVKLQDVFTNLKIPNEKRRSSVVAAAENGEIFWVEGLRIGESFKIGSQSLRALRWSWRRRAEQ